MSLEQVAVVAAGLRARRGIAVALDERRAGFEARAAMEPLPEEAVFTPEAEGRGLWVDLPDSDRSRIILWLHGGAFVLGSSASWRAFGARLAAASGARVLLADYPLAPEAPFPAALDFTIALLGELLESGRQVIIGGDSAGANLAAAAAQAKLDDARQPVGCVLLSPYLDLLHTGESVDTRASRDPFVDVTTMAATAATYLGDADPTDPRASPLYGPVDGFPVTLIQVGSEEALFDDAARFAARLPDCTFQQWAGMIHCWHLFAAQIDEGHWAIAQIGNWVRQRCA